ncbi:MAG: hypothetical protein JWP97_4834, partial [Labilithrix sp.]|nr:hypothetical protein [Labilithrix sp.]
MFAQSTPRPHGATRARSTLVVLALLASAAPACGHAPGGAALEPAPAPRG